MNTFTIARLLTLLIVALSPGVMMASEVTGVLESAATTGTEGTLNGSVISGSSNSTGGSSSGSSRNRNVQQTGTGTVLGASTNTVQAGYPGFPNAGTPSMTPFALVLALLGLSALALFLGYRQYNVQRS